MGVLQDLCEGEFRVSFVFYVAAQLCRCSCMAATSLRGPPVRNAPINAIVLT